jgi:hypothetical protein
MRFMFVDEVSQADLGCRSGEPMVRMSRPIGPFCRVKTCSIAARTLDLRPLARAVCRGIGLPRRLLAVDLRKQGMLARYFSLAVER